MHNVKLGFAALAALVLTTSFAYALEVKKKINAPALPAKVWEVTGGFCAIKDWHPLVADCKETEEAGTKSPDSDPPATAWWSQARA